MTYSRKEIEAEIAGQVYTGPFTPASYIIEMLSQLLAERDELQKPRMCSVCTGKGDPGTGKPCICGGAGTQGAELQGFRDLAYELQSRLDAAYERVMGIIKIRCNEPWDRDYTEIQSDLLAEIRKLKED